MPEVTILVVCTANICRSPVVEAILRQRLAARGLGDWRVTSGGTLAVAGYAASTYGMELLAERGLAIDEHRSRRVEPADVAAADLVLCMESGHAEALRVECPEHRQRICLLTEMIGGHEDVPDPYGGPRPWYQAMIDHVTDLIDRGLPNIVALAKDHAEGRADRRPSPARS